MLKSKEESSVTQSIRLTSKRQATFPAQVCRELGVKAGDVLILEQKEIEGIATWIIRPQKTVQTKWFGGLKKYGRGKDHDMETIRASIGKNLGRE